MSRTDENGGYVSNDSPETESSAVIILLDPTMLSSAMILNMEF